MKTAGKMNIPHFPLDKQQKREYICWESIIQFRQCVIDRSAGGPAADDGIWFAKEVMSQSIRAFLKAIGKLSQKLGQIQAGAEGFSAAFHKIHGTEG